MIQRITTWEIECDGCGEITGGQEDLREVKTEARRLGWKRLGKEWACPECAGGPKVRPKRRKYPCR